MTATKKWSKQTALLNRLHRARSTQMGDRFLRNRRSEPVVLLEAPDCCCEQELVDLQMQLNMEKEKSESQRQQFQIEMDHLQTEARKLLLAREQEREQFQQEREKL